MFESILMCSIILTLDGRLDKSEFTIVCDFVAVCSEPLPERCKMSSVLSRHPPKKHTEPCFTSYKKCKFHRSMFL